MPTITDGSVCKLRLEQELAEPFSGDTPEHVALRVVRLAGMLMTPTCNLARSPYWLFSPLHLTEGQQSLKIDTLFSSNAGYFNMFGLPTYNELLPEVSFIDLNDLVQINAHHVRKEDRLVSLSREASTLLGRKLANFQGRDWGYAPGEKVDEAGTYRCRICALYAGTTLADKLLKKDDNAPECETCKSSRRRASWVLLIQPTQKEFSFPRLLTIE